MEYRKSNEKEKNDSACRHCVYATKNYFTVGNRFFLRNISGCTRSKPNYKPVKPFKELDNCLYFERDRMTSIGGDMEQYMFFVSNQLENIEDLLIDIVDKVYPDNDIPDILKSKKIPIDNDE